MTTECTSIYLLEIFFAFCLGMAAEAIALHFTGKRNKDSAAKDREHQHGACCHIAAAIEANQRNANDPDDHHGCRAGSR